MVRKSKSAIKSGAQKKISYCNLPDAPVRSLAADLYPGRVFLIRNNEKKWVNNTVLHYYFFTSPRKWAAGDEQMDAVRDAFDTWKQLGIGLEFIEVDNPEDAEIRIGFQRKGKDGGSWSYVGRDAIDHVPDPTQRTMNFGWDLTTPYGRDTALHEIGHAMGFPHEHQNPNSGIVWNVDAVLMYFSGPPNNWNEGEIYHNILRKLPSSSVDGSKWDKDSIMHYEFEAGLIDSPVEYQVNPLVPEPGFSHTDISEVLRFYPDTSQLTFPVLKAFVSKIVKLASGQQADFIIEPEISRKYTIQTFGRMDTVMVLFEDIDGTPVYLSGDDDSGLELNSKIEFRLIKTRTYYLRLRLYYTADSGNGSIMMW